MRGWLDIARQTILVTETEGFKIAGGGMPPGT